MKLNHFSNKPKFLSLLIALGFFIVASIISTSQFVWIDEGFTLSTIIADPRDVWYRALIFEGQPPFYFFLLSIWRSINDSIFFIRLFSIFAVTISLIFVFKITKKYVKSVNPLIIMLYFALLPFVLWTALEIRVYALVILLSTLAMWLFLDVYTQTSINPPFYKRLLYSIVALISIYTQYYLVFLFVGNFIFLLLNRQWKFVRIYLIDMILPVISSLYLLIYLLTQISIHSYTTIIPISLDRLISINTYKISSYLFPYMNSSSTTFKYLFVLFIIVVIVSSAGKKLIPQVRIKNYFLFTSAFLLIIFTGLVFFTDWVNLQQRHTISVILPLAMTFMLFVGEINSEKLKYTILVLMISANVYYNFNRFVVGHPKGKEYVDICQYIENNDINNKPVFCYRNDISLMIKHYGLSNKIVQVPISINFDSIYNRKKWVIRDTIQLDSLFRSININNGFWLIMSESDSANRPHYYRYNVLYKYDMLLDYVSHRFNIISENKFDPGFTLRSVEPKIEKSF